MPTHLHRHCFFCAACRLYFFNLALRELGLLFLWCLLWNDLDFGLIFINTLQLPFLFIRLISRRSSHSYRVRFRRLSTGGLYDVEDPLHAIQRVLHQLRPSIFPTSEVVLLLLIITRMLFGLVELAEDGHWMLCVLFVELMGSANVLLSCRLILAWPLFLD